MPFLKRAQIVAADLRRAGIADFDDLDRLTMFADNLVPHVLRLDGVIWFDPELVARIEQGQVIEHGLRRRSRSRSAHVRCTLGVEASQRRRTVWLLPSNRQQRRRIDEILWNRGQEPERKAVPRRCSRSTAYRSGGQSTSRP